MRILYCNKFNFAFSGTEAYLFEVMALMRANGHEAALFAMADPRGPATPYDRHFVPGIDLKKSSGGPVEKLKTAAHAIYSRDAQLRMRKMIADFRPDIAHVRNIYHHLSPSILWELKAHGIPVIYHLNDFKMLCPNYNFVAHGETCERCQGGKFWNVVTQDCYEGPAGASFVLAAEAYIHSALKTYGKCVDRFLAPSQFVKTKLVENGFDRRRIDVLPHFQKLPPVAPPIESGAPILYFGRLSKEKGVADLIQAMSASTDLRLVIAGEGPQRGELEAMMKRLSLTNIQFVGRVGPSELDRLIISSRYTVFPSHAFETLGKSILESYAWGRPVIATDLGSRRELVAEGETGLLYETGNVSQLAAAIRFLDERHDLVEQMGRSARKKIAEDHDPEQHYIALGALYDSLTKPKNRKVVVMQPSDRGRQPAAHPLQIAFIGGRGIGARYSGIETYYEQVGSRLAAKGHKVTAYCRSYFTPKTQSLDGIDVVRLPSVRSKHLETLSHTLVSTLHASLGSADIVHYHCLGPALFSWIPRLFGKKTVVTVQGLDWQRKKWGRLASLALRAGETAAVTCPNATMTVSQTLRQHYLENHERDTEFIPNGTMRRVRPEPRRLSAWGIESGQYILFTGRWSPEKNCDLLIEAYQRLKTPVKLVLAGGGSHTDPYVEKLRALQSENIILLDWVSGEALDELLTHAMLFVLPSDIEGLSLALLDAMAAGLCVVTSDIPENREIVDGAGFTFRKGEVAHLAEVLATLAADPPMRQIAGRAAQQRILDRGYLWPQVVDRVENFYLRVMGVSRADARPSEPTAIAASENAEAVEQAA